MFVDNFTKFDLWYWISICCQLKALLNDVIARRRQITCVRCACRTWCGATARRSVLSGNTRWVHSHLCLSLRINVSVSFLLSSLFSDPSEQMEQKLTASEIFKDKKDNYPQSVPKLFVSTRLSKTSPALTNKWWDFIRSGPGVNSVSPLFSSDGEDINPKVLQAMGSEKMKVREFQLFLMILQMCLYTLYITLRFFSWKN